MSFAKIDDQFYLIPKTAQLDRDEQDLYFAGLVYASQQLTDGFIPKRTLVMLAVWAKLPEEANPQPIASRLVEHNFWELVDGGYQIHDFLDWNYSRDEVLAIKGARTEAGRRGGIVSASRRQASARANGKQTSSKIEPNPNPNTLTATTAAYPAHENVVLEIAHWPNVPVNWTDYVDKNLSVLALRYPKPEDFKRAAAQYADEYYRRYPARSSVGWLDWVVMEKIPPAKTAPAQAQKSAGQRSSSQSRSKDALQRAREEAFANGNQS